MTNLTLKNLFFILIINLASSIVLQQNIKRNTQICTYSGCMRGKLMPGYRIKSFEAYLGIPYAWPPVDFLRFRSPQWYPRWHGYLDATEVKPDCIQKNYLLPKPTITGREDCLYLNVYTPRKYSPKLLPVMVYIYGGGFFSGSANPNITGPEYIMDTEEVILVTFSYRLGALGFLSTNDMNMSGNFGLKDQQMALKWVQYNIRYFGGDRSRVTLFGQSAGAVSAHMLMLSKKSKGLFHSVIAMSGTAIVPFAIEKNPLEVARRTAEFCNITDAKRLSTYNLANAMRVVDAEILLNAGDGLKYWNIDHVVNYRPIVDSFNDISGIFAQHPKDLLRWGNYNSLPLMLGSVANEGAIRVVAIMESEKLRQDFNANFTNLLETFLDFPRHFSRAQLDVKMKMIIQEYFQNQRELNNNTKQGFLDLVSDRGFLHPLYNTMKYYVNTIDTNSYPIYLYNFNYKGRNSYATLFSGGKTKLDYGVVHCDDLIYLFKSPWLFPDYDKYSLGGQAISKFVEYIVHFAKYGNSNIWSDGIPSPCNKDTFNSSLETICDYQQFENGPNTYHKYIFQKTANKFNVRRMQFWNKVLND